MEIHENIKRLRKQRGLSQEELAHLVGYTDRSSIAKIEAGRVDLSQSKIALFANALGTTPAELLGWETDSEAFDALMVSLSEYGASGCFKAEDAMYNAFGATKEKLSTHLVEGKTAVLFYKAYPSNDEAGLVMDILETVRNLGKEDLLAVAGMLHGFVNRKTLLDE